MKKFHGPQSSQEANSLSSNLEILHLSLNPKVHYHVHKTLTQDPTLSKVNPVYNIQSYWLEINFNIILPTTPRSSKWLFPLWLLNETQHYLCLLHLKNNCFNTGAGIANNYKLDDQGVGVWVPVGSRIFCSPIVQAGSGAHPTSQPIGTRGTLPGSKAAEAWNWPLTSN
jgi:hypothetical protein